MKTTRETFVVWVCKTGNLTRLLDLILDEDSMMDGYADGMEPFFVEAFGERVECDMCQNSQVLPGHLCWDCEEWTAPDGP